MQGITKLILKDRFLSSYKSARPIASSFAKYYQQRMDATTESLKEYEPPSTIESIFEKASGSTWSSINRPTAGVREEDPAPQGTAPIQLYSLFTPNGVKASIMLEELGVEYDAHST